MDQTPSGSQEEQKAQHLQIGVSAIDCTPPTRDFSLAGGDHTNNPPNPPKSPKVRRPQPDKSGWNLCRSIGMQWQLGGLGGFDHYPLLAKYVFVSPIGVYMNYPPDPPYRICTMLDVRYRVEERPIN